MRSISSPRVPLDIAKEGTKAERVRTGTEALKNVQLPFDDAFLKRRCFRLGGGQRQRVAVARGPTEEYTRLLMSSPGSPRLRNTPNGTAGSSFPKLSVTPERARRRNVL